MQIRKVKYIMNWRKYLLYDGQLKYGFMMLGSDLISWKCSTSIIKAYLQKTKQLSEDFDKNGQEWQQFANNCPSKFV